MPLKPKLFQIPLRVSEDLLQEIDLHVDRMRHMTPGAELHRTDAVRSLVIRAIADIKSEESKRGKK